MEGEKGEGENAKGINCHDSSDWKAIAEASLANLEEGIRVFGARLDSWLWGVGGGEKGEGRGGEAKVINLLV